MVTVAKHDVQAKARVPSDLRDAVKASNTSLSEAARNGMKMAVYDEKVVEAEAKNEVDYEQYTNWESAIDALIADLESRDAEAFTRAEVTDMLETLCDSQGEAVNRRIQKRTQQPETGHEDELEDALADLERKTVRHSSDGITGPRVFPDHSSVIDVSREFGMRPEDVIEKLQERNPDVPSQAFEEGGSGVRDWNGLPTQQAEIPVEDREPCDERQSSSQSTMATDGGDVWE
ncbi:hypothetical protein DMJ13_03560 [halophilic archaeon]|nr:hypothetical protein DMJ13_03560 [halophilic archaeon]